MKLSIIAKFKRTICITMIVLGILIGSYISLLAFPQIILSKSVRSGTVVINYDGGNQAEMAKLADEVENRLRASRFYDPTRTDRVYYFNDYDLYCFYTRLVGVSPMAQGFNLSLFDNSYVSQTRIAALGKRTGHSPQYSIWEGDPAHTIAHEIGHDYVITLIGSGLWKHLPHWKQEGLPEYIANNGLARVDTFLTLPRRIELLDDDYTWRATQNWHRHGWDKKHYEAWLLVEFLFEVKKLSLEEIIDDTVTKEKVSDEMHRWVYKQRNTE